MVNTIHTVATTYVLSEIVERYIFASIVFVATAAGVLSGIKCQTDCGSSTPTCQTKACDSFWQLLSISMMALSALPFFLLLVMTMLHWTGAERKHLSTGVAPWCVCYLVLVLTYYAAMSLSGDLLRNNNNGSDCNENTVDWDGNLALAVQLLWVIMAAQPILHTSIFWCFANDNNNNAQTTPLLNTRNNHGNVVIASSDDDDYDGDDYEDPNAHLDVQVIEYGTSMPSKVDHNGLAEAH